jgi:hypothetical protein
MTQPRNLILSVEHSGTRFVKNHLLRGCLTRYHHLTPYHAAFIRQLIPRFDNLFVPMRNPFEVARSWARKGMTLPLLPGRFDFLASLTNYDPIWIPVDAQNRVDYIAEAVRRTGLQLDPGDWPKIGQDRSNMDYQMTDSELAIVLPTIQKHGDFFRQFYPEGMNRGPRND